MDNNDYDNFIKDLDFVRPIINEEVEPAKINLANKPLITYRKFEELNENTVPIKILPEVSVDFNYKINFDANCVICKAPDKIRKLAEAIYINDSSRQPNTVTNFFKQYYGALITRNTVYLHMNRHCVFNSLYRDGIESILANEELTSVWKYRELDLVLTTLMGELNDIKSFECKTLDARAKQSKAINDILDKILRVRKERDDKAMSLNINPFEILEDILKTFLEKNYDPHKPELVIVEKSKQLKNKLALGSE